MALESLFFLFFLTLWRTLFILWRLDDIIFESGCWRSIDKLNHLTILWRCSLTKKRISHFVTHPSFSNLLIFLSHLSLNNIFWKNPWSCILRSTSIAAIIILTTSFSWSRVLPDLLQFAGQSFDRADSAPWHWWIAVGSYIV